MFEKKWLVFIGAALAIMMVDIDITAVNLAITNITKEMDLSITAGQWIINGYTMAAACLMAFAGRVSDSYGHKRVFLSGLSVFACASLAVALADNFWSMACARIIQGACIAFTFPMASIFVRAVFPENQKGLAVSLLVSVAGISQAIGPSFGGMMIYYLSWHWIFIINLPLAIICFYLIYTHLDQAQETAPLKMEYRSLIAMILGLFSIMCGLNEVNQLGVYSPTFISLMILGVSLLTYFFRKEWTSNMPVLGLKALLNINLSKVLITRLILTFNYFVWLFGLGLLLQNGLGYNAFHSGLLMMTMTLTVVIFSVPVGKWIDNLGCKIPQITGYFLMLMTCILLSFTNQLLSLPILLFTLFLGGLSISLLIPATTSGSFNYIEKQNMGLAVGVLYSCGFIGNSIGIAIGGSIIEHHSIMIGFRYAMLMSSVLALLGLMITLQLKK